MQIAKVDSRKEEKTLLASITNTDFLNQIRPNIAIPLFTTKATKTVMKWCVDYFDRYEKAPGNQLNTIYENSDLTLSDTDKEYIDALLIKLSNLSNTASDFNVDYQIDQTMEFFKTRRLEQLLDNVQGSLMIGKVDAAEDNVVQYMKVEREENKGIDMFRDIDKIKVMSTDTRHTLFQPPGAVGELTGPFKRGDFVLFASRAKGGKTMVLQQVGMWASIGAHLKVLHLSLEMMADEVKDRYYSAFTGKRMSTYRGSTAIQFPYFDDDASIQYYDMDLPMMTSDHIEDKAYDLNLMSKGGRLVVEARAENSFAVRDLKALLDKYETQHDLVFDIVIVDYADIMMATDTKIEYRHRLDTIYKSLRGLAQERSLCVITATQSGRESFDKGTKATNISEDIRKLATVTHAFAINMTDEEKSKKYWRLSTIVSRRQHFVAQDTIICLACLEVARMIVDSKWVNETQLTE